MLDTPELFIDSAARRFGSRTVLSNVFINCRAGEVVGLLGRNGSGKSTLLKIIFGALRANYKHSKLNGRLFDRGYRTGEIAYLPQQFLLPESVHVGFAAELMAHKYRTELMEIALVKQHSAERMGALSGGVRRMMEALFILYSDASFVLLDEPFSNIAPLFIDELHQHIRRFRAEKGFIVTDHYYERILEISDRVVLIHHGCNYQINSREDLYTHGYIPASALE